MNRTNFFLALVFFGCAFYTLVECHSWVACTNYKVDSPSDGDYYDQTKCRAWPRNWNSVAANFGEDRGFNYQASETQTCRDPFGSAYTSQFPMAKYTPGQRVCLAWPTKNHVAATCTNQYIPDTSLQIFVSGANPSRDPTQTEFKSHVVEPALNGKHQNGVIDFKGFQNCPKFCENMDKSLCTGCFNVPSDLQVGATYTFQWYWVFNEGSAPYTTCWEASIVGSAAGSGGNSATSTSSSSTSTSTSTSSRGSTSTSSSSSTSTSSSTSSSSSSNGGTSSSTSSSGGATGSDIVIIARAPFIIARDGFFSVDIAYSTGGARQIVVEVVDQDGVGYAKGISSVADKGTVTVKVVIYNSPSIGGTYILRAVIVPQGYGNNPTGYELDAQETSITIGDKTSYTSSGGNSTLSEGSNAQSMHSTFSYSSIFFAIFGSVMAMII